MPGMDQTGPRGMGPMTGGRRGRCMNANQPRFGRGGGGRFGAPLQQGALQQRIVDLENRLAAVENKR
jgi:hypothetical protein